jgi:hypothetical protein
MIATASAKGQDASKGGCRYSPTGVPTSTQVGMCEKILANMLAFCYTVA